MYQNFQKPEIKNDPLTYHLTISAIIEKNDPGSKVFSVQKDILKDIDYSEIVGEGLYKYPKNKIHFSILDFERFSNSAMDEKTYKKEKSKNILEITGRLAKFLREYNLDEIVDRDVSFTNIYPCKSGSVALQAVPSQELMKLFLSMKDSFGDFGEAKLKMNDFVYRGKNINKFSVNLVRFFSGPNKVEFPKIADAINDYNFNLFHCQPIIMELNKITFVLSDNWLSNKDYFIGDYNLG